MASIECEIVRCMPGASPQGLLERDVGKRLSAAAALEAPWVREGGCAPHTPLEGTVVQRLQRHATYGHLKQLARCLRCDCCMRMCD